MPEAPQPEWRNFINAGVQAFRYARYEEAAAAFEQAIRANPHNPVPHLYLGLARSQQFISGCISDENECRARQAEAPFQYALALDPANWNAIVLLGHLEYLKSFVDGEPARAQASRWFEHAASLQPADSRVWCILGAIAYQRGRSQEAIGHFEKAVQLDQTNCHAMDYLSVLLHDEAAAWRRRATDSRSEQQQSGLAESAPRTRPPDPDWLLNNFIAAFLIPPPLPPPPPPPPSLRIPGGAQRSGPVRWEVETNRPPRIRVAPAEQAARLRTRVDPELPDGMQIEDPHRFVIVIATDGHVRTAIPVSRQDWLTGVAQAALGHWIYEAAYVGGQPVEVVTEVAVIFRR